MKDSVTNWKEEEKGKEGEHFPGFQLEKLGMMTLQTEKGNRKTLDYLLLCLARDAICL